MGAEPFHGELTVDGGNDNVTVRRLFYLTHNQQVARHYPELDH